MTIREWIDRREMTGFLTFSLREVSEAFPALSPQVVQNELHRLCASKRIQLVYKGFYSVIPLAYKGRGVMPPLNYIDQLMAHIGRPYYVSLLSAGVLNGAAHQRPQKLSVTTTLPHINVSSTRNPELAWSFRKEIPQSLLLETNSETSVIKHSGPELTAIDLVQYSQHVGGLSAAATVIAELVEKTDFTRCAEPILEATTLPTLQRLGYILDVVLEENAQATAIADILSPRFKELKYRPLSSGDTIGAEKNTKWKLLINQQIAPDDIW